MARPRRTTEEEWYDVFSRWDVDDQAIAIRVLEQIHRIARRNGKAAAQPTASFSLLRSSSLPFFFAKTRGTA